MEGCGEMWMGRVGGLVCLFETKYEVSLSEEMV